MEFPVDSKLSERRGATVPRVDRLDKELAPGLGSEAPNP
jgi:hypothetical protein